MEHESDAIGSTIVGSEVDCEVDAEGLANVELDVVPCRPLLRIEAGGDLDAVATELLCTADKRELSSSRKGKRDQCQQVDEASHGCKIEKPALRTFLKFFETEAQRVPFAGLTLAFLSVASLFSSVRTMDKFCLPCSLPDLAFFLFLPLVSLDLAEQQLLASAFPWQQDDLLEEHSVFAFLSVHELLWADAVAPNRNRAPRRRICFILINF